MKWLMKHLTKTMNYSILMLMKHNIFLYFIYKVFEKKSYKKI